MSVGRGIAVPQGVPRLGPWSAAASLGSRWMPEPAPPDRSPYSLSRPSAY